MAGHNNRYRENRPYDEVREDRWLVRIEGQNYYFLDKEKAVRCWKQFWEASDPILVPYSRYVKDPNR